MKNLWQRVADFFVEWDGEDMSKTMSLSVDDLRLINNQRILLTTLEREKKEIKNKTIDEFVECLKAESFPTHENYSAVWVDTIDKITERMKGDAKC